MSLLDRLLGRKSLTSPAADTMPPDAATRIIQEYGAVLRESAPGPGCIADVRNLPHSKERIKQALVFGLRVTKDPELREQLKFGYLSLADWQEEVGPNNLGIDPTNWDPAADPMQLAKQISAQGELLEKWKPLVRAEQEALEIELKQLGQWRRYS